MTLGTFSRISGAAKPVTQASTVGLKAPDELAPSLWIREHDSLHGGRGPSFCLQDILCFAPYESFEAAATANGSRKARTDWYPVTDKERGVPSTVWESPKLRELLAEPLGSPIDLTQEEAEEIVMLAFGRRKDLQPGKAFVEDVRELLGHSLIERLKETE